MAFSWKKLGTRIQRLLRAGVAGLIATGADLLTLVVLVDVARLSPRAASVPALIAGGIVNFIGNRDFVFNARSGNLVKQSMGYIAVELGALALNAMEYDAALRIIPAAARVFWLVRLGTTNLVFLGWSYPLWHDVFRAGDAGPPRASNHSA